MIRFLFSRIFLFQLIIAALIIALSILGVYVFLNGYSRAGESIEVPDLNGLDLLEAETGLKNLSLQGFIVDSTYVSGMRGGEILVQDPPAGTKVKPDRKIYLTVARYRTPMKSIPNVLEIDASIAAATLESYGFKIGEYIATPGNCSDCLIGIHYRGNEKKPGSKVPEGAVLDLLIGSGEAGAAVNVPMCFGLNLEDAKWLLNEYRLNVLPIWDTVAIDDSAAAVVFYQSPSAHDAATMGSAVEIRLTSVKEKVPAVNVDSIRQLIKR